MERRRLWIDAEAKTETHRFQKTRRADTKANIEGPQAEENGNADVEAGIEVQKFKGRGRVDPEADIERPQAEKSRTADPQTEPERPWTEGKVAVDPKAENERYEVEKSRRVSVEAEDSRLYAKTNSLRTEYAVPRTQRRSIEGLQTEEKPPDAKNPQSQSQQEPQNPEGSLKKGQETMGGEK